MVLPAVVWGALAVGAAAITQGIVTALSNDGEDVTKLKIPTQGTNTNLTYGLDPGANAQSAIDRGYTPIGQTNYPSTEAFWGRTPEQGQPPPPATPTPGQQAAIDAIANGTPNPPRTSGGAVDYTAVVGQPPPNALDASKPSTITDVLRPTLASTPRASTTAFSNAVGNAIAASPNAPGVTNYASAVGAGSSSDRQTMSAPASTSVASLGGSATPSQTTVPSLGAGLLSGGGVGGLGVPMLYSSRVGGDVELEDKPPAITDPNDPRHPDNDAKYTYYDFWGNAKQNDAQRAQDAAAYDARNSQIKDLVDSGKYTPEQAATIIDGQNSGKLVGGPIMSGSDVYGALNFLASPTQLVDPAAYSPSASHAGFQTVIANVGSQSNRIAGLISNQASDPNYKDPNGAIIRSVQDPSYQAPTYQQVAQQSAPQQNAQAQTLLNTTGSGVDPNRTNYMQTFTNPPDVNVNFSSNAATSLGQPASQQPQQQPVTQTQAAQQSPSYAQQAAASAGQVAANYGSPTQLNRPPETLESAIRAQQLQAQGISSQSVAASTGADRAITAAQTGAGTIGARTGGSAIQDQATQAVSNLASGYGPSAARSMFQGAAADATAGYSSAATAANAAYQSNANDAVAQYMQQNAMQRYSNDFATNQANAALQNNAAASRAAQASAVAGARGNMGGAALLSGMGNSVLIGSNAARQQAQMMQEAQRSNNLSATLQAQEVARAQGANNIQASSLTAQRQIEVARQREAANAQYGNIAAQEQLSGIGMLQQQGSTMRQQDIDAAIARAAAQNSAAALGLQSDAQRDAVAVSNANRNLEALGLQQSALANTAQSSAMLDSQRRDFEARQKELDLNRYIAINNATQGAAQLGIQASDQDQQLALSRYQIDVSKYGMQLDQATKEAALREDIRRANIQQSNFNEGLLLEYIDRGGALATFDIESAQRLNTIIADLDQSQRSAVLGLVTANANAAVGQASNAVNLNVGLSQSNAQQTGAWIQGGASLIGAASQAI